MKNFDEYYEFRQTKKVLLIGLNLINSINSMNSIKLETFMQNFAFHISQDKDPVP